MTSQQPQSRDKVIEDDFDHLPSYQPLVQPIATETPRTETAWYKRAINWLLITGISSLLLGLVVTSIESWLNSLGQLPLLASALFVSNLLFVGLLLWFIGREALTYLRVNRVINETQELNALLTQGDKSAVTHWLKQLTQHHQHSEIAQKYHHAFWQTVQAHHTGFERLELYQRMVSQPLKQSAEALIQPAMLQGAGISLLSPNNLIHSLILLWRSAKLVRDIAGIYGIRPGFFGSLKLLKVAIENMIIQQGVDLLVDAGMQKVSQGVLGKVVEKGSEATTTGLLLRRLGKAMIRQLDLQGQVK
jgi:putative membrane protein